MVAELVPKPLQLTLGAGRRFGQRSRDDADRLSAYFSGLFVVLAAIPRAFRTGIVITAAPHSVISGTAAVVWTDQRLPIRHPRKGDRLSVAATNSSKER